MEKAFHSNDNVVFLSISSDEDEAKWKKTIREKNITGLQIRCTDKKELYKQFGIGGIPHFVIVDPTGYSIVKQCSKPSTGVPHHLLKGYIGNN